MRDIGALRGERSAYMLEHESARTRDARRSSVKGKGEVSSSSACEENRATCRRDTRNGGAKIDLAVDAVELDVHLHGDVSVVYAGTTASQLGAQ